MKAANIATDNAASCQARASYRTVRQDLTAFDSSRQTIFRAQQATSKLSWACPIDLS